MSPGPLLGDTIPGSPQRWWFWVTFVLAWGSTGLAQGIASVAAPQLLKSWNPDTATGDLSMILTVGGLAILVTTPIFGRLSDRSMSRLGLRRPWLLYGALFALAGYLVLGIAGNVAVLAIGMVLTQIGFGAVAMAQHSLFADQIRRRIRAIMSAVTGAASAVGVLIGVWVTGRIAPLGQFAIFVGPGAVAVLASISLFFTLRDRHRTSRPGPIDWHTLLSTFWLSPRRYPDFAWAWLCRFFMTASIVTVTSYLYLTISQRFRLDLAEDITAVQTTATAVFTVLNLTAALVFGVISDRSGKRKLCVVAGASFSAIGLLVAVSSPSITVFLIGIGMVGAGQGAYIAADVALMTECLPSTEEAGKDLGIVALAYLLPGILVPVAGFFLTRIGSPTGQNFVALYIAAFVMAVFAAVAVTRVKSVP
ncbi:MFS transporter [Nakamurella aerolata]|uniref:MFS transporter n=1 Tax=Nakamurella aerolata TaxID=1656892 RepID=UPI001BB226B4